MPKNSLNRCIALPSLIFYGLGTILGAGIYVLVGKVAGEAGMFAPISFVVAALLAAFTAFSYAELSARYPRSAAEVSYVQSALKIPSLSTIVGYLVVLTGIVSAATLANGFTGYLGVFIEIPEYVIITTAIIVLGLIAFWGIGESVKIACIITIIEVGGLLFVIALSGDSLLEIPNRLPEMIPSLSTNHWGGIFVGAFLAFYAFIGFEDMVNTAEEVKNPRRNLPIAIISTLVISTVLYLIISLIAVLALPLDQLTQTNAPLADIVSQKGQNYAFIISIISIIAIINGALIQIIMASRVLYGMSKQKLGPKLFSYIHPKTKTPLPATILVTIVILILALWFPLVTLARTTSFIIISIFALVNFSLFILKIRKTPRPKGVPNYPIWMPFIGMILSLTFLCFQILEIINN